MTLQMRKNHNFDNRHIYIYTVHNCLFDCII